MNALKHLVSHHRLLYGAAFLLFLGLSLVVAILPALENQTNNAPLPDARPLSPYEEAGKNVFIANGCVACHTQQVRNVAMDGVWGQRPSIAADYAFNTRTDLWRNTATLMGTERTGPDLTNIGLRQPSKDWHLLHLYNPRSVVPQSIMPAYSWMFEEKGNRYAGDIVVNVPAEWKRIPSSVVVAKEEALQLVAYLLTLKQVALPDGTPSPEFLYKREAEKTNAANAKNDTNTNSSEAAFDGAALYTAYCQSCHQENGEGLQGAFPPLKGSTIVMSDDAEQMVNIIMSGYDARPEYAVMPAVGTLNNLSAGEIAAIMNHERTHWGNIARTLTTAEVAQLIAKIKKPQ